MEKLCRRRFEHRRRFGRSRLRHDERGQPSKPCHRDVLMAAKNLRIISKYTIGVDDIDVEAATEYGQLFEHH